MPEIGFNWITPLESPLHRTSEFVKLKLTVSGEIKLKNKESEQKLLLTFTQKDPELSWEIKSELLLLDQLYTVDMVSLGYSLIDPSPE